MNGWYFCGSQTVIRHRDAALHRGMRRLASHSAPVLSRAPHQCGLRLPLSTVQRPRLGARRFESAASISCLVVGIPPNACGGCAPPRHPAATGRAPSPQVSQRLVDYAAAAAAAAAPSPDLPLPLSAPCRTSAVRMTGVCRREIVSSCAAAVPSAAEPSLVDRLRVPYTRSPRSRLRLLPPSVALGTARAPWDRRPLLVGTGG